MESFVNWIAAGQNLPSFLEKLSSPEVPWLAYLILTIEGKFEECTLLWPTMQQELLGNPKMTVEQAWKVCTVKILFVLLFFPANLMCDFPIYLQDESLGILLYI